MQSADYKRVVGLPPGPFDDLREEARRTGERERAQAVMGPSRHELNEPDQPEESGADRTPRRLPPSEIWRSREEEPPEPRRRRGRLWLLLPFVVSLLAGVALVGVFALLQDVVHRGDFTGDACFFFTILAAITGFVSGRQGWDHTVDAWMRRETDLSYGSFPVALVCIGLVALAPTVTWIVLAATGS